MIEDILILMLCVAIFWIMLVLLMLPVYFIRKKRNPLDKKNTLKSLIINALIASILFWVLFCSGLIKMYLDEVT